MFVLSHLGIGLKLSQPFAKGLPRPWIALGALLPDLVDKPLFYLWMWITGSTAQQLTHSLISGTRTFGHTALVTLSFGLLGLILRDRRIAALSLGMGTHLVLDSLFTPQPEALLWPLWGWQFPLYPFTSAGNHLAHYTQGVWLAMEALGAVLLVDEIWFKARRRRRSF